jgi:hypothetical protein
VTPDPHQRPDLPADLAAIGRWLAEANPSHYRQLALYLQVMREVLPGSVDQALFQLVTQIHPGRYAALPQDQRALLHQRLVSLVQRSASLLTVEQLSGLAARQDRQRRQRQRQRQQRLVDRLIGSRLPVEGGSERGTGGPADSDLRSLDDLAALAGAGFGPSPAGSLPPGSVSLGMELPLRGSLVGWSADAVDPGAVEGDGPLDESDDGEELQDADRSAEAGPFAWDPFAMDSRLDQDDSRAEGVQLPSVDAPSEGDRAFWEDDGSPAAEELDEDPVGAGPWAAGGSGAGLLPRDPLQLEVWLRGYDQALARRLRNLSHAINGELMRFGLLPILLPASLLDAVLEGRIDTLGAAPNLLRLQLPMPLPGTDQPFQATVLLLRSTDLELDQPRLRQLRRELQRRRQEGHRMAQHFRRLQRRSQAREAEALWLQDIRTRQGNGQNPPPKP